MLKVFMGSEFRIPFLKAYSTEVLKSCKRSKLHARLSFRLRDVYLSVLDHQEELEMV